MYKLKHLTDMKGIAATNKSHCNDTIVRQMANSLIGLELNDVIKNMVNIVRQEISGHKKTIDATDEQLVENVLAKIEKKKCTFPEERYDYYLSLTRKVVWDYVNEKESKWIISHLKSGDRQFAQKFFYGTNNNGCNISRFRSKIIAEIRQSYHVDVTVEEFGNIVYAYLWNKGTWDVLDKYSQKGSFFCWLERVCRHEVIKVLEDMKIINVSRERTTGNTRLLGASISPNVWSLIISELMPDGLSKNLMEACYVDGMKEKKMMKKFHMTKAELCNEMKNAETMLKDKLIRSDSYYEEIVLRDKSPRNIEVSEEYIKDFVKWVDEKNDANPLADVFGVNLSKEELNEKVTKFLYDFSEKLQWSDEDRIIWRLRFIENISPVQVAEECDRPRAWLDTRYSRLNQKFTTAIRKWWNINS